MNERGKEMEISGMKILKSELEDVPRKDDDLLLDLVNEINAIDNSLIHLNFFENYIYDFEKNFETKEDLWFALRGGKYSFDDEYIQINQYNNIDSYSFVEVISMVHDNMDNILNMYLENYNSIDGFEKLENVVGSYYMKKINRQENYLECLSILDLKSKDSEKFFLDCKGIVVDFFELDNIMSNGKYYNIYFDEKDDYIIKSMKREKIQCILIQKLVWQNLKYLLILYLNMKKMKERIVLYWRF